MTAHQLTVGAEYADAEKVVVVKDASHVVMLSQRNGRAAWGTTGCLGAEDTMLHPERNAIVNARAVRTRQAAFKIPSLADLFEPRQRGRQIGPENLREISAFLNEDRWESQSRDGRTDAPESVGGDGEARERIML